MLHHPSHVAACRMMGGVRFVCTLSEVVETAANAAFAETVGDNMPSMGGRKVDIWSLCFQGGTFDRVKERCRVLLSTAAYLSHRMHIIVCRRIKPLCRLRVVMHGDVRSPTVHVMVVPYLLHTSTGARVTSVPRR